MQAHARRSDSFELKISPAANMVDLAGYVIILVQTQDGKIKLFGESDAVTLGRCDAQQHQLPASK